MPRRRIIESQDGLCPYCGSNKNISGGSTVYGLRRFECECGSTFTFGAFKKANEITISIFKYRFRIPIKTATALALNKNDGVRFVEDQNGIFFIKDYDSVYRLHQSHRGLEYSDYKSSENFRFIFNKLKTKSFTLYLNENQKVMGLITKQNVRNKISVVKKGISRDSFIGIRTSGTSYISSRLRETLMIDAGDELFLYDKDDKIFITIDIDKPGSGFKISRAGVEGFNKSLMIASSLFAQFFINRFGLEKGQSYRIMVSDTPTVVDEKTMFEVFGV